MESRRVSLANKILRKALEDQKSVQEIIAGLKAEEEEKDE